MTSNYHPQGGPKDLDCGLEPARLLVNSPGEEKGLKGPRENAKICIPGEEEVESTQLDMLLEKYRDVFGDDMAAFDFSVLHVLHSGKSLDDFENPSVDPKSFEATLAGGLLLKAKRVGPETFRAIPLDDIVFLVSETFDWKIHDIKKTMVSIEGLAEKNMRMFWPTRYTCHVSYVAWTVRKILLRSEGTGSAVDSDLGEACAKFSIDTRLISTARKVVIYILEAATEMVNCHLDFRSELRRKAYLKDDLRDVKGFGSLSHGHFMNLQRKTTWNGGVLLLLANVMLELSDALSSMSLYIRIVSANLLMFGCALIPFMGNYTEWNFPQIFDRKLYIFPKKGKFLQMFLLFSLNEGRRFWSSSTPDLVAANLLDPGEGVKKVITETFRDAMGDVYEKRFPCLKKQLYAIFNSLQNSDLRNSGLPMAAYLNSGALLLVAEDGFEFHSPWPIISEDSYRLWRLLKEDRLERSERLDNEWASWENEVTYDLITELLLHIEGTVNALSWYLSTGGDYLTVMGFFLTHPLSWTSGYDMCGVVQQILHDVIMFQFDHPEFDFTEMAEMLMGSACSNGVRDGPGETSAWCADDMPPWSIDGHARNILKLATLDACTLYEDEKLKKNKDMYLESHRLLWCHIWRRGTVEVKLNGIDNDIHISVSERRDHRKIDHVTRAVFSQLRESGDRDQVPLLKMTCVLENMVFSVDNSAGSMLRFVFNPAAVSCSDDQKIAGRTSREAAKLSSDGGDCLADMTSSSPSADRETKKQRNKAAKASRATRLADMLPKSNNFEFPSVPTQDVESIGAGVDWMNRAYKCKSEDDHETMADCFKHASEIFGKIVDRWTVEKSNGSQLVIALRVAWVVSVLWNDASPFKKSQAIADCLSRLNMGGLSLDNPIFQVLIAKFHLRRRAFLKAEPWVSAIKCQLRSAINIDGMTYPCTNEMIPLTAKEFISAEILEFERDLETRKVADQYCRSPICAIPVISYHVKFEGFHQVHCTERCEIVYHNHCLTAVLSTLGIKELKDIRGPDDYVCLTPDCAGAVCKVKVFDEQNILKTVFVRPKRPVKISVWSQQPTDDDWKALLEQNDAASYRKKRLSRKQKMFGCEIIPTGDSEASDRAKRSQKDQQMEAPGQPLPGDLLASIARLKPPTGASVGENAASCSVTRQPPVSAGEGTPEFVKQSSEVGSKDSEKIPLVPTFDGLPSAPGLANVGVSSITGKPKIPARLKKKYRK